MSICGRGYDVAADAICPICLEDPSPGCAESEAGAPPAPTPIPPAASGVVLGVAGERIELADGEAVLLGREGDARLRRAFAQYGNVSRRHATVSVRPGVAEVQDLASTNGTYVPRSPAPGVEPDFQALEPNVPELIALPATIRLARNCYLELRVKA